MTREFRLVLRRLHCERSRVQLAGLDESRGTPMRSFDWRRLALGVALPAFAFAALVSPARAQDDCPTTTIGAWEVQYGEFCEQILRDLAAGEHRIEVSFGFDYEHQPNDLWISNRDPGAGTLNNLASEVSASIGGRNLGTAEADISGYVLPSAISREVVDALRDGDSATITIRYNSGEIQAFALDGADFAAAYARAVAQSAAAGETESATR